MRFVVYGAGGIGGVIGAALHQSGHDVTLIARGPHLETIRKRGLRLERPEGGQTLGIRAVGHPGEAGIEPEDVVLLTMKSQDTTAALRELAACCSPEVAVFCVQNGVDNERQALRHFRRVHAVCVMCPAGHLEPGVVIAYSSPLAGILDLGRYPSSAGETAEVVGAALRASTFESEVRADIMRWKYRKLLMNLGNALEALGGPQVRTSRMAAPSRRITRAVSTTEVADPLVSPGTRRGIKEGGP